MKKLLLFISMTFFSLIIILSLTTFIYSLPYLAHYLLIHNKWNTAYFPTSEQDLGLLTPQKEQSYLRNFNDHESIWQSFHMHNFQIDLPVANPLVDLNFYIESTPQVFPLIGYQFLNSQQKIVASLYLSQQIPWDISISNIPFFEIPFIKNKLHPFLSQKEKIYNDLFELDLNIPIANLFYQKHTDLIYSLFIWKLRQKFFPQNTLAFYKVTSYQSLFGVIKIKEDGKKIPPMISEKIFILNQKIIWQGLLHTNQLDNTATTIRERIFSSLYFNATHEDEAQSIYQKFTTTPYRDKSSDLGIILLFSAWTQSPEDKKEAFLKSIIQFLEKGNNNLSKLQFLYTYGINRYGKKFLENLRPNTDNSFSPENSQKQTTKKGDLAPHLIGSQRFQELLPQAEEKEAKDQAQQEQEMRSIIFD